MCLLAKYRYMFMFKYDIRIIYITIYELIYNRPHSTLKRNAKTSSFNRWYYKYRVGIVVKLDKT